MGHHFKLEFSSGPDGLGRREFSLSWEEPDGIFRTEPSKEDGQPVGYRRGQVFKTNPAEYIARLEEQGNTVEVLNP